MISPVGQLEVCRFSIDGTSPFFEIVDKVFDPNADVVIRAIYIKIDPKLSAGVNFMYSLIDSDNSSVFAEYEVINLGSPKESLYFQEDIFIEGSQKFRIVSPTMIPAVTKITLDYQRV